MQNDIKNRRKASKDLQRQKQKGAIKYALVTVRGPTGEPELVFREMSNKKRPEELKEIYIGKPETERQAEEAEEILEEECELDEMDDAERQFLEEYMGEGAQVEEVHEMEDDGAPEVVERNYEVDNRFEDVPIVEEEMQVDNIEDISDDFDLRSAPVVKLNKKAEDFLVKQLFGSQQETFGLQDEAEQELVQQGLDFFARDIKPKKLEEIDQDELDQIKEHMRDAVEMSEGSDVGLRGEDDEETTGSGDGEYDYDEGDEGSGKEEPQFKVRRPRKERLVTLDMVNENRMTDEEIKKYVEKVAAESQEAANNQFDAFVEQNTRTLVQAERLEDQYADRPETMKRRIAESSMITISKTGVPKNVYREGKPREEEEVQEGQEYIKVVMPHNRAKDESAEDRKARKELVKEAKKIRKDQKRDLKNQFAQAKGNARKEQERERQNLQGRRLD